MQAILDSMDEVTQDSTQSSLRAAKDKRGKEKDKSNFSHNDAVEIYQMAIKRLEEDNAHIVKELEDLEQLMNKWERGQSNLI